MSSLVFEKLTQAFAAAQAVRLAIAGDFFRISDALWPVTVRIIRGDRVIGTMANWQAGDYLRGVDFDAVEVVNGATAQNVTVQIAGGGVGSDRVLGEVAVIDGGKSRVLGGASFVSIYNAAPVAGQYTYVGVRNPAGSGVNVVVNQIMVQAETVAGIVAVRKYDVALASSAAAFRFSKNGGVAYAGQHVFGYENNAASLGAAWAARAYVNNTGAPQLLKTSEPLVIPQGAGMVVASNAVNMGFSVSFEGYEEAA